MSMDSSVLFRVDKSEKASWEAAAKSKRMSLSEWLRGVANAAVKASVTHNGLAVTRHSPGTGYYAPPPDNHEKARGKVNKMTEYIIAWYGPQGFDREDYGTLVGARAAMDEFSRVYPWNTYRLYREIDKRLAIAEDPDAAPILDDEWFRMATIVHPDKS